MKRAKLAAKPIAKRPVKAPPRAQAPASPTIRSGALLVARPRLTLGAWQLTSGAAETVVAVLDTGIDRSHPDLQGSFVEGRDCRQRGRRRRTTITGHGTLVAGVIAARSNNGLGGVGACSQCSLMPVKVIGAQRLGQRGGHRRGNRLGSRPRRARDQHELRLTGPDDGVAAAIAYARLVALLIVAAAGNAGSSGRHLPRRPIPASSASPATDPADERYAWSSYGGWVRLAAPGCSVATGAGGSYADFCGTSSATALVSGLAALIRSYAPAMTVDELGEALAANALKVGDFVSAGRVDVEAAVGSLTPTRPAPEPIGSSPPGADQRD